MLFDMRASLVAALSLLQLPVNSLASPHSNSAGGELALARRLAQLSSRSENFTLCGDGKPPTNAVQYGTVSFPTTTDADNTEYMDWMVKISTQASADKPMFFFTNAKAYKDVTSNRTNTCSFTPSPGSSFKPPQHRRRQQAPAAGNSTSNGTSNGTSVTCEQIPFFTCSDELQSLSLRLRGTTISNIGDSIGLACQIERDNGATLGISDCGLVEDAVDPQPATYDPWRYDRGLVLGPVIGGVGLVILIVGAILFVRRRRRARARRNRQFANVREIGYSEESVATAKGAVVTASTLGGGREGSALEERGLEEVKMQGLPAVHRAERERNAGPRSPLDGAGYSMGDLRPISPASNPSDIASFHSRSRLIGARESEKPSRLDQP